MFFFEKKNQKTFTPGAAPRAVKNAPCAAGQEKKFFASPSFVPLAIV